MTGAARRDVSGRPAMVIAALAFTAGLLAGCGASSAGGPPVPATSSGEVTPSSSPAEGTTYDIGGYALWMQCEGEGSTTVVFDSGLGSSSTAWSAVEPAVAQQTRACVYDRAGIGSSDPRPAGAGQPTVGSMAAELRALLSAAGEAGPFVVVGHSFGGMVTQEFADRFPQDVVGVVLVDSSSAPQLENPLWITWFGDGITRWDDGPSAVDLHASKKELMQVRALGSVPLVVLTQNYTEQGDAAFQKSWNGMQRRLAAWSDDSVHVVAVTSGHDIPGQAPELVVTAVSEVVRAARTGDPLEPCSQRFEPVDGRCTE